MADQQFCLRWNHHHTTLINVFESLLKDESLVDVTLYAEARPVRAHKVVLSACSPYFKAIFSAHSENHPVVILKDVLYSELRALVDYMYIGEVNVCQDQLASLIKSAESLKIKGLADGVNRKPPQPPPPPTAPSPPVSLPMPMPMPMPIPNLPPMPMPPKRLPHSAPPMPALASLPPLAALPGLAALQPLQGLALPPPPSPFQHALRRSASPHAVPRGSPLGRPAADQLNGRVSPPPSKRARRPSGDQRSPVSFGSPSPPEAAGDHPERPPSAHSSPSLPRIPATITPLPTSRAESRADSPAELDLSCRPPMKAEPLKTEPPPYGPPGGDREGRPAASVAEDEEDTSDQQQWHSDDGGDGGDEQERLDEERAGPSAPPGDTRSEGGVQLNSSGYMNWQLGGDGVEVPFIPATEAGGPQEEASLPAESDEYEDRSDARSSGPSFPQPSWSNRRILSPARHIQCVHPACAQRALPAAAAAATLRPPAGARRRSAPRPRPWPRPRPRPHGAAPAAAARVAHLSVQTVRL